MFLRRAFHYTKLVVKPILCNEMNSKCHVDLIDMQSKADEQYKFILVYQEHLTKFVQLRPLKTKRAEVVAYVLLHIFTIFDAPSILQSNNDREFANNVIKEMCNMWLELKMVHGKPRHSQNQGSVERCNQDVENMLSSWLETNNTNKWSEGLRFVKVMKNRAHRTDINCSPYEVMLGATLKIGLKNFIPNDSLGIKFFSPTFNFAITAENR
ncbi:KRAB-A domain-containing protein 2-like [Centruroides sculpturatus]|uniref:KRAB-A domain-containing protein 2-like n=1 Tax=Centruroides sculpturatus TaxID=218467 RepID=UPI000C6D0FBC|nr:KRAB-A domain-containing protein 2-like [Centruroides sculpturatus]